MHFYPPVSDYAQGLAFLNPETDNSGVTIVWPAVIGGFIVLQLVCAVFGAYVAEEKNRNSGLWMVLCLLFGLVALVAIAGVPAAEPVERKWPSEAQRGWNPLLGPPRAEEE